MTLRFIVARHSCVGSRSSWPNVNDDAELVDALHDALDVAAHALPWLSEESGRYPPYGFSAAAR